MAKKRKRNRGAAATQIDAPGKFAPFASKSLNRLLAWDLDPGATCNGAARIVVLA
jgi:hypothetical protein